MGIKTEKGGGGEEPLVDAGSKEVCGGGDGRSGRGSQNFSCFFSGKAALEFPFSHRAPPLPCVEGKNLDSHVYGTRTFPPSFSRGKL